MRYQLLKVTFLNLRTILEFLFSKMFIGKENLTAAALKFYVLLILINSGGSERKGWLINGSQLWNKVRTYISFNSIKVGLSNRYLKGSI